MPTYEYSCQKCGQTFEAYQSMRDAAFRECPKNLCRLERWGHGKVKRLLGTGAGVIFKGSGFYTTDYRSKSYQEGAKKEAPASASGDSASDKKPETKKEGASPTPAVSPPKSSENKPKKEASG
jgi:putative FmdB family regulatory protein